ncbi:MAG: SPFH domain-containing protein, partial [Solobacterium sp.]|nr:SPFH domain-containing protein [Solobacterium sp.]
MGLILTAANAIGSTLADQWKEYFYCDAIPSDTICIKGLKKNGGIGNFGSDDIISDGSMIAVADGQCMLIVEQGQVVDICAEPGIYRYDASSEPSIFTGNLSDSIKNVFATIGRRFEFGGSPSNTQRIYYINTKELLGVKYGTANPIPFRIVDTHANIDMDISLKCFGEYSLKVVDPILFYTNVCANVTHSF